MTMKVNHLFTIGSLWIGVFFLGGMAYTPPEFALRWGRPGDGPGEFAAPEGIALGPEGQVYVADTTNHRVQVFSADGEFLFMWGSVGTEPGQFLNPVGLATDADGNVYVADVVTHRVQVFDLQGRFLRAWGEKGSEAGQFQFPSGVAVFGDRVSVTDNLNHRVQVFDREGHFLAEWGTLCDLRTGEGCVDPDGGGPLAPGDGQFLFPKGIAERPSERFAYLSLGMPRKPEPQSPEQVLLIDARGYPPEGENSLAREIVSMYHRGFRQFVIVHTKGQRFIGCGLGPRSQEVRLDVYGSSGDYLASGVDGAEVHVHGSAQDQLAQIFKAGKLVIYGDVGQTFLYAAKGGEVYVLGNAAGRPLINAVGYPRVVINGTCLDYLAESFMAGEPLQGGGFVIVNGISVSDDGEIHERETLYPGGNLFSLASGGAIYIRDPYRRLTEDQLNGGQFRALTPQEWELLKPYLEENKRLFGISIRRLLEVDGKPHAPEEVYRVVRPGRVRALQAEEAWVRKHE